MLLFLFPLHMIVSRFFSSLLLFFFVFSLIMVQVAYKLRDVHQYTHKRLSIYKFVPSKSANWMSSSKTGFNTYPCTWKCLSLKAFIIQNPLPQWIGWFQINCILRGKSKHKKWRELISYVLRYCTTAGLLRRTINRLKQERSITPKLTFIRGGHDDATAFENYLIEEQDVDGSGLPSLSSGFVSFLEEVAKNVVEYLSWSITEPSRSTQGKTSPVLETKGKCFSFCPSLDFDSPTSICACLFYNGLEHLLLLLLKILL